MRIAILGAGSIGTIVGAYLTRGGKEVDLITRNRAHVDALNHSGAKITGSTNFTVPVRALTPDEMSGTYDLVLLLTKQLENQTVLRRLLPFLHDESIICSLQNGIPEQGVASMVGVERVIGGTVEFGATWIEPGVCALTSDTKQVERFAFQIGELNGEMTDRIQQVQSILSLVGGTHISRNLVGSKWSKLWLNSTFSGLSAALNCTFGDVAQNDVSARSAIHIANEVIQVGLAKGVQFAPLFGMDIQKFAIQNEADIPPRIQLIRSMIHPARLIKASMLQDLEKKKQTEIDYINGVVQREAIGTEVQTPFNNLVVQLIKAAEDKQSVPDFETNLSHFEELNNTYQ